MSSTNRGAVRSPNDFYVTDPAEIGRFLRRWCLTDPQAEAFWSKPRSILDPSAGGLTETITIEQKAPKPPLVFQPSEMSYPKAINEFLNQAYRIKPEQFDTIDIRQNSKAATKGDFINYRPFHTRECYDMVITNPPFSLALEFIRKALMVVRPGGYVVMLLRLNFFGSEDRNPFFLNGQMPDIAYVHSKRLGFTPDGKTDSIEYMHAIWKKTDFPCHETKLRVLPY